MYIRERYVAGQTIITREKMKRTVDKCMKRAPREKTTSEKVWRNNLRYAIFRLTLILNTNFKPGDHLLTLTYKTEPSKKEAEIILMLILVKMLEMIFLMISNMIKPYQLLQLLTEVLK